MDETLAPFAIAVVGRACVLPGALTPEELWQTVAQGQDQLGRPPEGRWRVDPDRVLGEPGQADRAWTDRGGYVRGFERIWNPGGFAVPAAELAGLDPFNHWLLHCAREALADAGDRRGGADRPGVGAVFGNLGFPSLGMNDYGETLLLEGLARESGAAPDPRNRFMTGGAAALLERALGLGAGVMGLDCACASSLYAIKLACDQLREGRADLMLAGGVSGADSLLIHMGFCALQATSRTGQSRPFHAQADGLVPAEGASLVALKRLADARRDGDRVFGILRGVGLSNDGRSRGLLTPDEDGQTRAMTQAYAVGAVDPLQVSLLECHATGTPVGDGTEIRSTARVFAGARDLPVGSLKANIGHAITAAGAAGLIKVLECLRHGQRAPNLHVDPPTQALAGTPLRLITALEPWPSEGPRFAAVSAFGFGGNNAHLVVSEDDPGLAGEAPAPAPAPAPLAVVGIGITAGPAQGAAALVSALLRSEDLRDSGGQVSTPRFSLGLAGLCFPPRDLERALPQQVLALAAAREAMAGVGPWPRDRGGVFLGVEVDPQVSRFGARWRLERHLAGPADPQWLQAAKDALNPALDPGAVLGNLANIPANRLNIQFDQGGSGWTLYGGVESGRRALELAVRALRRGELDGALVGAMDLSCQPVHQAALESLEGLREPAGDAAVMLVLRRLEDARREGDPVLAILEDAPATSEDPVLDPAQDPYRLRDRLGRCWAAGELRDLAVALLLGRQGVLPDGRPWPAPRAMTVLPGPAPLRLRPSVLRPELVRFAGADPADLDQALALGRTGGDGPCRAAIVAAGAAQLDQRVAMARQLARDGGGSGPGVWVRTRPLGGELALVFGGAGASYPGMGETLLDALPQLRRELTAAAPRVHAFLDAGGPRTAEYDLWSSSRLTQAHARICQDLLGLAPDALLGYCSGESKALFACGVWTDADAMFEDIRRSGLYDRELGGAFRSPARAWAEPDPTWETWLVRTPIERLQAALEGETRAHLAVIHHGREGILSGEARACARVRDRLGDAACHRLPYDLAVHVPEFQPFREEWLTLHRRAVGARPRARIYSGASAAPYEPDTEGCAQAILAQAAGRLDFRVVVERAYQDGVRVFLEQGPRGTCTRWIKEILGPREALVVPMDRKGESLEGAVEAAGALWAAGVPCTPERLMEALTPPAAPAPGAGPSLEFQVSPRPALPPWPSVPAPPPAPEPARRAQAPDPEPRAQAPDPAPAPRGDTLAEALRSRLEDLGQRQRAFVTQQAGLHLQFLTTRARAMEVLAGLPGQPASARPAPVFREPAAAAALPVPAIQAPAQPPSAPPAAHHAAPPEAPAAGAAVTGPAFSRADLEIHASGAISRIFGPAFQGQDAHPRQVRMPKPPLLLADRVTGLRAEPMSMGTGAIWTETDVRADSWYLHAGHIPAGILIEAGQADLMLISYLGVDAENLGERVYRLLGCTLTFHGGLPRAGDTLRFDIHLDGHAKAGPQRLMFFHSDCRVDGQVRLAVRQGQAGFFSDAELAGSEGCLWRPEDQALVADPRLDPPALDCPRHAFSADQVAAFAAGRPWDCFGPAWNMARPHTRTPRIAQGPMRLFDTVDAFEVKGGPWGRGYLAATTHLTPETWFFDGHFHNDPCMPGTLMFEACLQAMAFYLTALGYTVPRDGWRFEPVPDEPFVLTCRGQVTPQSRRMVIEVFVEEVQAGPLPTLHADLLVTVDGLKAFHARRVGLRLTPAWPLDEGSPLLDGYEEPCAVATSGGFPFGFPSVLACATGRPSLAFGPFYTRFDGLDTVARLPGSPYLFISRILEVEGQQGAMVPGMAVHAEFDIPEDAWYFAENGNRTMPFAVLLEAALQPCGWLASYMGCALACDEPLMFRNLDGKGTVLAELPPEGGPLHTRARNTSLSRTGSMIIVGFDVECRRAEVPVFRLKTVFGFFPATAFENQAGLPTTEAQSAALAAPALERPLDPARPGRARLARPMLLMLDRIDAFDPAGGAAGLGLARGQKDVDPGEWFFKAHFFQDPVQPGSLGIEAMIQLLQLTMLELGMDEGMAAPRFELLALDEALAWKFRGQVTPSSRLITTTLEITGRGRDGRGAFASATASLWVDGKRIYEVSNLAMRIVDGGAGDGRRTVLDPARQPWLLDHRPAFTMPALPMMVLADLMAQAARPEESLAGLRDVRVLEWVLSGDPLELSCERDGDRVELWARGRKVATGRLCLEDSPLPPAPLPALEGASSPLPYLDGTCFHGPAFQLMESLVRTGAGASSTVRAGSPVPPGRLNPGLLDAALHGIPHDRLDLWNPQSSPDAVAYPAWIQELQVFGPTPLEGLLRCEVRPAGFLGGADFPVFEIQIIRDGAVWCRMRLVEACLPKGPLGAAAPAQRRAFLRDRVHVPGLSLARTGPWETTLPGEALAGLAWIPGGPAAIYGTSDPREIARREHIAAAHALHPARIPAALPLRTWDLEIGQDAARAITVAGSGHGALDLERIRTFWTGFLGIGPSPVEDLQYGLIRRFLNRVVVEDPEAYDALQGRPVLYLANHQVGVESVICSNLVSGLGQLPTMVLAKIEHQHSWIGRLNGWCFSYPGILDPGLFAYFDRAHLSSLRRIVGGMAREMEAGRRSVLVHVAGTRSLTCAEPTTRMAGIFVDTALETGVPIVPVRFRGGLPREPLPSRIEFPVGMGRQDIWLGRPIQPGELASLYRAARNHRVLEAINLLGGPPETEQPHPGDAAFAARVEQLMERHGLTQEHAVLRAVLMECPEPSEGTRSLLQAMETGTPPWDDTPEGRWLAEIVRNLGGRP